MLHKLRWALLWAVVILVLTLMPGNDVPAWSWAEVIHLDKIVHVGLFSVFTILLGAALMERNREKQGSFGPLVIAVLIAVAYGAAIELFQGAMGMGRTADIMDVMADGAGALLGYAYLRWRSGAQA